MRLPIDPKDLPSEPEVHPEGGLTVETVIPGTVSLTDVVLPPFPRVNGSGILLASPAPDPLLGIFVAGDVRPVDQDAPPLGDSVVPSSASDEEPSEPDSHPSTDVLAAPVPDPVVGAPSRSQAAEGIEPGPQPKSWATVILGSYASAVTLACLWLWWQGRHRAEAAPDEPPTEVRFEHGFRADRSRILKPPEPILAERLTDLGKTLKLDALEFTPLGLSREAVRLEPRGLDGERESRDGGEGALVLRVRLKNRSENQVFAPMDEAFLRQRDRGQPDSFLETASGGRIEMYPLAVESEWSIAGQEFKELRPGESLETILVSEKDVGDRASAPMTWRLHLRTSIDRTETIGVRIRKEDIP
jgi:hypothetical protein